MLLKCVSFFHREMDVQYQQRTYFRTHTHHAYASMYPPDSCTYSAPVRYTCTYTVVYVLVPISESQQCMSQSAKVPTYSGGNRANSIYTSHLVCVYTPPYTDTGIVCAGSRPTVFLLALVFSVWFGACMCVGVSARCIGM